MGKGWGGGGVRGVRGGGARPQSALALGGGALCMLHVQHDHGMLLANERLWEKGGWVV